MNELKTFGSYYIICVTISQYVHLERTMLMLTIKSRRKTRESLSTSATVTFKR